MTTQKLKITCFLLTVALLLSCNKKEDGTTNAASCTDADGYTYKTVVIGSQEWMAENLKTSKYNDGTRIEMVAQDEGNNPTNNGAFCYYNYSPVYDAAYGKLYNWNAIVSDKLCPSGWHVPNLHEWNLLALAIGGWDISGLKLKATEGWSNNGNGTDDFEFKALPSGEEGYFSSGAAGYDGNWWIDSDGYEDHAPAINMHYYYDYAGVHDKKKSQFLSVRCIKDTEAYTRTPKCAFTVNKTEISVGENVNFTDQSTNSPTSWSWDFGDGETSTQQNPTHTYNTSGVYSVSQTVSNSYGSDVKTKSDLILVDVVKDIDGNIYNIITIGTQVWMKQNLKTTKFNEGTSIPKVTNSDDWTVTQFSAYCWNNNSQSNNTTYGALYNLYAAQTGNLCPTGWHVPTDDDWTTLINSVGGESVAGIRLKSVSGWSNYSNGIDAYGFSALPGGYRTASTATFSSPGTMGIWWGYGESNISKFILNSDNTLDLNVCNMNFGFSVRCIKNN